MSARERTAYWVQTHSLSSDSPSTPPSDFDYSSPPSEAGSSHSLPPRMILRFEDGRPDMAVPRQEIINHHTRGHRHDGHSYDPRHVPSHHRATSHASSHMDVRSRAHRTEVMPNAPEKIRVLPSAGFPPPQPRTHSSPIYAGHGSRAPPQPQQIHIHPHPGSPPHLYQATSPRQRHQHPGRHEHPNYGHYQRFHHPPQVGPNGVIYSHSAPPVLPGQGHPNTATYPHMGVPDHIHIMHRNHPNVQHSRNRSVSLTGRNSRPRIVDCSDSSSSGSEPDPYYLSRSRRASTTSPDKSVTTATSSGRSPVTPSSKHDKRPFFQRLFHFAGKVSQGRPSRASSEIDDGSMQRRHSISGSRR